METRMAEYIMVILKSRMTIVWSWGASQYIALSNGLIFHVEAFLYTGWVKILYNEATDAFDVYFLNNHKKVVKTVEEVYIDSLIDCIDYNVENNGGFDYDKKVRETYSKSYIKTTQTL